MSMKLCLRNGDTIDGSDVTFSNVPNSDFKVDADIFRIRTAVSETVFLASRSSGRPRDRSATHTHMFNLYLLAFDINCNLLPSGERLSFVVSGL